MEPYSPLTGALPNGLQLLSVERPQGKTFALALAYGVGTFDDPPAAPGTAHFCEHLAFRGPNTELVEQLGTLGVDVNACTYFDYTLFFVRGHIDHFPLAVEFVANILRNEPRNQEEIEKERSIIRHEYRTAGQESDREATFEQFSRAALGDPHWKVTPKQLLAATKRLTADALSQFMRTHFRPTNARLSFVGAIPTAELQRTLEKGLSLEAVQEAPLAGAPARYAKLRRRLTISVDAFPYVWMYVTYIAQRTDPTMRFAAEILANLSGGGPHSMLFRALRTDRQLAYSVYSDDLLYRHCTALYWGTTVSRWSVNKVLDVLLECEKRFLTGGISANELETAKLRLARAFELRIDYPEHLAAYLAYESLRAANDAVIHPDDYVRSLADLGLGQLNDSIKQLLDPVNRAIFIGGRVGPLARFLIRRKLKAADRFPT